MTTITNGVNNTIVTHAVLSEGMLFKSTERKITKIPLAPMPHSLSELCDLANSHDITHVWVMPGIDIDMTVSEEWDSFISQENLFARIWKRGLSKSDRMGRKVKVGFPDRGRWAWEIDNPISILAAIHYLETILNITCEWSPGHMGTALVRQLNRTRPEWIREPSIDLFELPFNKSAQDIIWKARDLWDIQEGLYLHQFDKRSAYLSACPGVAVGAGNPIHVSGANIDTSHAGIYRVSCDKAESIFDGGILPEVVNTAWITGDIVRYALSQGYQITIHEAWQWEEQHRTLESYATTLFKSRRAFRDYSKKFPHAQGRENAENTMKEIALVATGKFAYPKASQFLRPDWWAMIVGKTRENILRNLDKLYKLGFTPVLIYSDSLYFVSTDANPRTAIPGILDRENALGGYRHEGTWKITPEMIAAFHALKPGEIVTLLNKTEGYCHE